MNVDRYLRMIAGAFVLLSLALGLLGESVLVSVHRVRRTQPVSISFHQLVSDDDHPSEVGSSQQLRRPFMILSQALWWLYKETKISL